MDELLDEFTRGGVLQRIGPDSWRFRHELLREVAAELSPPSVRRRLHSRIGDALVGATDDSAPEWALVAHHYQRAERFGEAVVACQNASANATAARRTDRSTQPTSPARWRTSTGCRPVLHVTAGRSPFVSSVASSRRSRQVMRAPRRRPSSSGASQLVGDEPGSQLYATFTGLWSYYATRGDLRSGDSAGRGAEEPAGHAGMVRGGQRCGAGAVPPFRGEFRSARAMLESGARGTGADRLPEDRRGVVRTRTIRWPARTLSWGSSASSRAISLEPSPHSQLVEGHCNKLAVPARPVHPVLRAAMEDDGPCRGGPARHGHELVAEVAGRARATRLRRMGHDFRSVTRQLVGREGRTGRRRDRSGCVAVAHSRPSLRSSNHGAALDMKTFLCRLRWITGAAVDARQA